MQSSTKKNIKNLDYYRRVDYANSQLATSPFYYHRYRFLSIAKFDLLIADLYKHYFISIFKKTYNKDSHTKLRE